MTRMLSEIYSTPPEEILLVREKGLDQSNRQGGKKRPAVSESVDDKIESDKSAKRSRSETKPVVRSQSARNAVDASYLSSRRWLERQVTEFLNYAPVCVKNI